MAMNETTDRQAERREIEQLLPWYVADTLDRAEHERVADYIRQHPEISSQLELVRDELDETISINESLGAPSAGALDRLMTSVAAEPKPGATMRKAARKLEQGFWQKLDDFLIALTPNTRRLATVTAALLIVAQAALLGVIYSRNLPGTPAGVTYETATGPEAAATRGTFAIVKFADGATSGAINSLLTGMGAKIVDGPKPGGIYRIRLSSNQLKPDDQAATLEKLRSNQAVVVFAEPAQ